MANANAKEWVVSSMGFSNSGLSLRSFFDNRRSEKPNRYKDIQFIVFLTLFLLNSAGTIICQRFL